MLLHYLKTGLRQIWRYKFFSLINILGLAISMSVCLLIIMLIKDAHSFDRFHPQPERTYRMVTDALRKGGGEESYASSPYAVGRAIVEEYSLTEAWVPFVQRLRGDVKVDGDQELPLQGLFTTGDFFKVFGFELAAGDPATALAEPFQLVLTEPAAVKLFGDQDPLGKVVNYPAYGEFVVTGVLRPFPGKTHLEFEALGSLTTVPSLERTGALAPLTDNWNDYYSTYNFFRLKEGVAPEEVAAALAEISRKSYAGLELESRDMGYNFRLQALSAITPGPVMSQSMGQGLPEFLLWFLSALGLIVMLSAAFNYTNLTIARSLTRTQEIGIRKVNGASRRQVVGQLLGESVLLALLALVLAYQLLKLIIPGFNSLSFNAFTDITLHEDLVVYGWFLLFAVGVGLVAGLLPALVMSKVSPLVMFQKLENVRLLRGLGLRKVLIVLQFLVSLVFLVVVTVAAQQMRYILNMDYGFNSDQLVTVSLQGQLYETAGAELARVAGVERISAISHNLGTWADSNTDVRREAVDEPAGVRDYFVDHQFIDNLELTLVAGDNFVNDSDQKTEQSVIVNETFLNAFKLGSPQEAIGQPLILGDSSRVTVRGVLKDFLFKPATYSLEPLLLRYDPGQLRLLQVRVSSADLPATIAALENAWEKIDAEHPFQYEFYEETLRDNYSNLMDMLWIVGFITFLAVTIACLGLLGIATYTVETRRKEISIRKVIGAGWLDLAMLLTRGFFVMLGVATVIALPLGYLLGNQFLQQFAFRIEVGPASFLPGILLLFAVATLAIGSQTVRAVMANPVDNLRRE